MQLLLSGGVAVFRSHFMMTNSTIVKGKEFLALFDPAYFPDEVALIGEVVGRCKKANVFCFYTHFDFDHVIDPPGLKAHRVASEHIGDRDLQEELQQWNRTDSQLYIERENRAYPQPDHLVTQDEEVMDLAGEEILIAKTPGHTVDSLSCILPGRRLMLSGDMLSDKEFPFIYHDFGEYSQSLNRLKRLINEYQVDLLIPGHGNVAMGKEIQSRLDNDLRYLEDLHALVSKNQPGESDLERLAVQISYGGQPIPDWQMQEHLQNLKKVLTALVEDRL